MKKIAVLIKTHEREKAFFTCIRSVQRHFSNHLIPFRFYIGDDSKVISRKKERLYKRLLNKGHFIQRYSKTIAVTAARNSLLDQLQGESYILRIDDDFELTKETNVPKMMKIIEYDNNIGAVTGLERQIGDGKGIVSGELNEWIGFLNVKSGVLQKKIVPVQNFNFLKTDDGINYAKCDLTRNFILLRREVFQDIKWEEKLTFQGEHVDFLLQLKYSKWDVVFTTETIHSHREDFKFKNDQTYRKKKKEKKKTKMFREVFQEKWGIRKIRKI
ncbi:glycosyltransferase [Evansella tamaricis]|uniref:Glycosyltransferase n=1 Tax=Evansella tamaricis TaxID=2069301 RepID=A0ABS6JIA3_9BACI|nr:glycosyltransferase [Evansella tamaricis]MBU9713321.1 glycosyltransferase [Evansella tamaricis]